MTSIQWTHTTLGDFIRLQRGHDLPTTERKDGSIPVMGSFGITGYHDTPKAEGPGVTIGRSGASIGVVNYAPGPYWPLNTTLYVTDFLGNNPRFVYYYLQTIPFADFNSGSAQPSLNRNYIASIPVRIPPKPDQEAIAEILGALDDKIELNRKMNATLDELARTIFRSWFVDFDPVRVKMEGREPFGMDAETAALFPERLVESPLGPIPENWSIQAIGDSVTVVGGSTPSTKNPLYWDGGTHLWATPKDLSGLPSPILIDTSRKITDEGVLQISSRQLPVGTVLLSSRAPVGYLAITTEPTSINQGFIGMICNRAIPNYYALNWARENLDVIKSNAGGTTFAEISKTAFRPIQVIVPNDAVLGAYMAAVSPLYALIEQNLRESETLAQLRDTLLPELISGRIRVPEAEKAVAEVV